MRKAIEPLLFIASFLLGPFAVIAYFVWMVRRWAKSIHWPSAS